MYDDVTMSHRTQITLTDSQYERLLDESRQTGLGLAELVRRALTRCYGEASRDERLLILRETFGAWQDREISGEESVEQMRRGMGHRLADLQ